MLGAAGDRTKISGSRKDAETLMESSVKPTDANKFTIPNHGPDVEQLPTDLFQFNTSDSRAASEVIQPRKTGVLLTASPEQKAVWLQTELNHDPALFNRVAVIHRHGPFKRGIFEAAFSELLRRHESLRTSLIMNGNELTQVVHPAFQARFALVDLSRLPAAEREAHALRLVRQIAAAPLDLSNSPLMRGRVVCISKNEFRIVLVIHRIVADHVSIERVLVPELAAIYSALSAGKPNPLPEPALQYVDYSAWRVARRNSPVVIRQLQYWKDQLGGDLPVLNLPADHPRHPQTSSRVAAERFRLSFELAESLRAFSRAHQVKLSVTLLTAFKVLLFRYTGQRDLIVGTPVDARRRPELENVIGCFADNLPIRTNASANSSFSEYVQEVARASSEALAAADVPFTRIVEAVNPRRSEDRHPVFQAFFSLTRTAETPIEGWTVHEVDTVADSARFDIHLQMTDTGDGILGRLLYNPDLFNAIRIERMARHFQVILKSTLEEPNAAIGLLPLLTEEELNELNGPGGWNDTDLPFPQVRLHELIESQAGKTPDAEAAVLEDVSWTYRQLMDRSDAICAGLRRAGITRGSLVAVVMHRSLDLLASLLAILKAGAAYLPLDPAAPKARLALCMEDANPEAILTESALTEIPESQAPVLFLEQLDIEMRDDLGPPEPGSNDDLAYVIHTSGTTGRPKGVEISHRSIVNELTSMQIEPGFSSHDRMLALATISFDIAGLEFFLPLISGGSVVIVKRAVAYDPWSLAQAIKTSHCTVVEATPPTWLSLLASGWPGAGRPIKGLCGGEPMPHDLADRLLARGVELWNVYGPTETTVWATAYRVTDPSSICIGRPCFNYTLHVLDAQKQLLPVGIPGRLYIGGVGLARGYRALPQATIERFTYVESVGARLYDTGDLGVRRPDGNVECLGRVDGQVKVRGYRLELEAIEAAVRRHPHVAAAAARVWPDATGSNRLSVYVVGKAGPPPDAVELRNFLKIDHLEYMIPSDVIALETLPLSLTGKVDRAKLPPPEKTIGATEAAQPHSLVEKKLAAIWSELLKVETVGMDENFFDLGGHSLLVVALHQRIHAALGHKIPMSSLFQSPVLRQQAALIEAAGQAPAAGLIPLQPKGTRPVLFWVHPPPMIGYLSDALGADQPLLGIELTEFDLKELGDDASMESIAERHVRTIQRYQPEGPYYLGGLCTGGIVAFEAACQLRAAGHEVPLLILLDAQHPASRHRVDSPAVEFNKACFYLKKAFRETKSEEHAKPRELTLRFLARVRQIWSPATAQEEVIPGDRLSDAAIRRYRPQPYDGNVLLVQPKDRPNLVDHSPGWKMNIRGQFLNADVDGHHDDVLTPKNVGGLAALISSVLADFQAVPAINSN